jgi:hypothetical protein
MKLQEHIRKVLKEETEGHKLKLVTNIIYTLYDNISFIKQSTFNEKPLLIIYFDSDDTAANIESWFDEKISRDIREWTSGNIVVCPNWAANWDSRKKNADVYINTELIKYDNLGNVINESVLKEETNPIMRRILRRADPDSMDKIFKYGLGVMTTRYLQNKHNWHAMNIDKFKQGIVSYVIVDLCVKYSDICYGGQDFYNQTWEFLLNHYSDLMEERWKDINAGKFD